MTHGAPVNVTVTVTPASPARPATLPCSSVRSRATRALTGTRWSGGTVTWTTNLLPGGTYPVIAHYAGDGTYGGSYSSPSANVTVNPESSSVVMPGVVIGTDSNGNPVYSNSVVYGTGGFILFENNLSAYWLRADVQNSAAQSAPRRVSARLRVPPAPWPSPITAALYPSPYKVNSFGFTDD